MIGNLLIFCFLLSASLISSASKLEAPKLIFEHGIVLDYGCETLNSGSKANAATREDIIKEATALTQKLQKQWDSEGAELLSSLINIVGREYSRRELTVYTTVCGSGSKSSPLLVSIRRHLDGVNENPYPLSDNMSLVLHEFIHKYLVESFDYGNSPTLKEFSASPALFKNHIHVMALIKASMEDSGKEYLIKPYVESLKGRKAYMKAWKVGTSKKYYPRLIQEIRSLSGSNKNYWFFDPPKKS